jgi:hypothetical protein
MSRDRLNTLLDNVAFAVGSESGVYVEWMEQDRESKSVTINVECDGGGNESICGLLGLILTFMLCG